MTSKPSESSQTQGQGTMQAKPMMMGRGRRRAIFAGVGLVAAVAVWGVFRPELLFVNARVNESLPTSAGGGAVGKPLAMGMFHGVAHETKGTASIYRLENGRRVLRLTDFETSNGPDVRVLLVAASDAKDNDTVKNGRPVELAPLKGNIGDQNYDLPEGVDLKDYKSVVVWCNRFGVNFGAAPLMTP